MPEELAKLTYDAVFVEAGEDTTVHILVAKLYSKNPHSV